MIDTWVKIEVHDLLNFNPGMCHLSPQLFHIGTRLNGVLGKKEGLDCVDLSKLTQNSYKTLVIKVETLVIG